VKNRSLLSGVHILLVDDEPDARDLFQAMLESYSAIVVTAASAKDAVRILDHISFDVLVADIAMPNEDGYWLIKEIRRVPAHRWLPAIAVTAFGGPADTLTAGYNAFIKKPVDPDTLCETVAEVVRSRRATLKRWADEPSAGGRPA
jgi:CheY-like chemotaxis protein